MKLAVISDIHGNCLALEAVLADIRLQGADMVVNLGDLVAGPLEPARTADLLMEGDFPTIKGNHERWVMEARAEARGAIDTFATSRIDDKHLSWIESLPPTLVLEDQVFLCHGTPKDDTAPWLDNWWSGRDTTLPDHDEVAAQAEGLNFPVMLCGHTHLARAVRLKDGRLIVNPGAVGLQIVHGSPDARYAILENLYDEWRVSLRSVPYDHQGAARQARDNGFDAWSDALLTGWSQPEGLF